MLLEDLLPLLDDDPSAPHEVLARRPPIRRPRARPRIEPAPITVHGRSRLRIGVVAGGTGRARARSRFEIGVGGYSRPIRFLRIVNRAHLSTRATAVPLMVRRADAACMRLNGTATRIDPEEGMLLAVAALLFDKESRDDQGPD